MKYSWRNISLKSKLLSTLTFLLVINSAYFNLSFGSVREMNGLVLTLYDKVVMSSTYAEMVRNDFLKFSALVTSIAVETDPPTVVKLQAEIEDVANTFRDDLGVVKDRAMSADDTRSIGEISSLFEKVVREGMATPIEADSEAVVRFMRSWKSNPDRVALIGKISDLTDKIVADGYSFRLDSEKRTGMIQASTIAFSIGLLVLNCVCFVLVLLSVLPSLRKLTEICERIAAGKFGERVQLKSKDEFGTLADAFNTMLEALKESETKIQRQLLTTNAMIDGLGQGFLMIDSSGVCLPVYSKACDELLEASPGGKPLSEVLKVPASEAGDFNDWVRALFMDQVFFEDMAAFGPKEFKHSQNRVISLEYKPLRDASGQLQNVVLVATDKTGETLAKQEFAREQEFSRMVTKLVRNRAEFSRYLREIEKLILALESAPAGEIMRLLHTIKGGAATLSLPNLRDAAHRHETSVSFTGGAPNEVQDAARDLKAEFQDVIDTLRKECSFTFDRTSSVRELESSTLWNFFEKLFARLQNDPLVDAYKTDFIFEPIQKFFVSMNDTMGDVALSQKKKIREIEFSGANPMIYADRYSSLFSSLVHVFRNAVDHGIEPAEERELIGKDAYATVRVDIQLQEEKSGRFMTMSIRDDGRGINTDALRLKLESRGVDVSKETDAEIAQHIFDQGVSTAQVISDISGRGVGMDVVSATVNQLGGKIWVESTWGQGTTIWIRVPQFDVENRHLRSA